MSDIPGNYLALDSENQSEDALLLESVSDDILLLGPLEDEIIYMVGARLVMIGEIIYE